MRKIIAMFALLVATSLPASAATLFEDTFSPQQPGWSFQSPSPDFLGELNNNENVASVTLTVTAPSDDPNATLEFDLLGFRSLDGVNCCTDTLTLTINGTIALTGAFSHNPAINKILSNPSGATYTLLFVNTPGVGGANSGHHFVVPHAVQAGVNIYTWSYTPLQSFADEAWGLDNVRLKSDLVVNGHVLKGNEEKWVRFVGEEIVQQLAGSRDEQTLVAARASWWGLKEGIFTFPNPHKFSLCNVLLPNGKSKDKRLQPLEICSPGRAWQVGLAGVQVPNFSDQEVSAVVSSLQPGRTENDILVEAVSLAKFNPGQGTGAAIVASTGVLKKSWLLRHPAVGLTLVERNVTAECINPVTPPSYCYGTGWLQTRKYAPTPDAIQQSIEDLMKIYDALAP